MLLIAITLLLSTVNANDGLNDSRWRPTRVEESWPLPAVEPVDFDTDDELVEWEEIDPYEETRYGLDAYFGDGFAIESWDGEYELRWHILGQVDFKFFSPGDQDPAAHSGVYIPRVRLYFEGRLTEPFEYELSLQRSLEGVFDLLDANVDYRLLDDRIQIRVGRFLVPYSYAWYDHLEQYFLVPERALFPLNFGLARASGASIWGELGEGALQYSFAAVDGRLAGLADNSTTADGVGYLNMRPFLHTTEHCFLRNLNIGGSLGLGQAYRRSEPLPLRTAVQSSENDESAFSASVSFLEWEEETVGFGDRFQGAIHMAWYHGPWTVESEWQSARLGLAKDADSEEVYITAEGFHAGVGCFITGETIESRTTVKPLRPVDPRYGHLGGAVELFFRYSDLKISDVVFSEGLANPNDWTNQLGVTDLGFNWYWNEYLKWSFLWQHASFQKPVLINEEHDRRSDTNDLYWIRGQVYF